MGNFLVLTELFAPTRGGSAVWFDKVYRLLGGRSTHILTAKVANDEQHDAESPLTIHRLKLERNPMLKPESLPMYLRLLGHGIKLALSEDFHSIHAGRVLPEGLIALLISSLVGKPCLIYAHGEEITTWNQPAKQKALRFVYRHATGVVANSRFTRDLLLDMGVSSDRVHLINPGVDIHQFHPDLDGTLIKERYGLKGKKIIFSVGRLSRRKGFDQMILALPSIIASVPDAHYVLGGIGEDRAYLEELVADTGVSDHVTFAGKIPDEELPFWYNLCEVFIMPNRKVGEDTEGFGMVFIEANACGTPAIAGIEGGTADAVVDGETGLRVDGTSIDEIAQAVVRVLSDSQFQDRLGQQGLRRAHKEFSWESIADKTKKILELL